MLGTELAWLPSWSLLDPALVTGCLWLSSEQTLSGVHQACLHGGLGALDTPQRCFAEDKGQPQLVLALWATSQTGLFQTVCARLFAVTNFSEPISFLARALPWWVSSTVVTTNTVFPFHDELGHNWHKHLVQGELAKHSSSSGFIHSMYCSLFESAGRHLSGLC